MEAMQFDAAKGQMEAARQAIDAVKKGPEALSLKAAEEVRPSSAV